MTVGFYRAERFASIRPVVEDAIRRWNDRVRRHIRDETRLRLRVDNRRIDVPVRVAGQWPSAVRNVLDQVQNHLCPLIDAETPAIRALAESADRLRQLVPRLVESDPNWSDTARRATQALTAAEEFASQLLGYANSHCDVVGRILSIEEDVLGAYFYGCFDNWTPQHIEIYYPVIALVAPYLNVSVEALSVAVLIHELSHAYTHLGQDIDGLSWDTDAFGNVELAIKEGLAQYCTHRVTEKLRPESPAIWEAYSALVKKQPQAYRVHLAWAESVGPEAVRSALLVCRNRRVSELAVFESVLRKSQTALREAWREA